MIGVHAPYVSCAKYEYYSNYTPVACVKSALYMYIAVKWKLINGAEVIFGLTASENFLKATINPSILRII